MIIRRRSLFLALALVLLVMDAAFAQTSSTTSSSSFDISWSALDPGDDWTWQMLQSVFPVNGTPPTNTGTAATLIGTLLGQITGLVMRSPCSSSATSPSSTSTGSPNRRRS